MIIPSEKYTLYSSKWDQSTPLLAFNLPTRLPY